MSCMACEEPILNGGYPDDASRRPGRCTPWRKSPGGGSVGRLLRDFCETSSMRSVPRIVRAPTGVQRLLWVFALLVGVGMTSYQLYHLLGLYFSYRTSINMVHVMNAAPFPDVTVCNLNPLWVANSSRLNMTWTYEDYTSRLHEFFSSRDHIPAGKSYLFDSLQTYEGYLQYFTESDLTQVHDHLVWDCRWEYREGVLPRSCTSNVTRNVSPYYGPCNTFHMSDVIDLKNQPSRLTMMLFVNDFVQGEITDFFLSSYYTYSSGVRLLVHPPGTFPLMDEGVNLPPGHESTISVRATKRQLMGSPYDACVDVGHIHIKHSDEMYTYTKRVCQRFCLQDYTIDHCACVDPYTPFPKSYRGIHADFCGVLDFGNHSSVNRTLQHLECLAKLNMEGVCDCPHPCNQYMYDIEVSQVPWPHVNYHMAFYHKYLSRNKNFSHHFGVYKEIEARLRTNKKDGFAQLRETDLITRNFLEISVLLDAEQTTLMEDYPVLSLESLFGNMGGILNLWIGITFVTAVEIMDLLWVCVSSKRSLIKTSRRECGERRS